MVVNIRRDVSRDQNGNLCHGPVRLWGESEIKAIKSPNLYEALIPPADYFKKVLPNINPPDANGRCEARCPFCSAFTLTIKPSSEGGEWTCSSCHPQTRPYTWFHAKLKGISVGDATMDLIRMKGGAS
jgi:hypothetical protein